MHSYCTESDSWAQINLCPKPAYHDSGASTDPTGFGASVGLAVVDSVSR
jgi:hypothetical protein